MQEFAMFVAIRTICAWDYEHKLRTSENETHRKKNEYVYDEYDRQIYT